jgi:hypothetical protein
MILPTKHLPLDRSTVGVGAMLLKNLRQPRTVSELWELVTPGSISTFDQFVAGLDLLYLLGAVDHIDGRLVLA